MLAVTVTGAAAVADKTSTATGTSLNPDSGTTSTLSQSDNLVIGAIGLKGDVSSVSLSPNEGTDVDDGVGTSGCSADRQIHLVTRVVTSVSGVKSSGTISGSTNRVWAAGVAVFKDQAARRYAIVNGSNGNWSDGAKWSLTSGGSAANVGPNSGTDCIFDNAASTARVRLRRSTAPRAARA
jgi:hypothetical protein